MRDTWLRSLALASVLSASGFSAAFSQTPAEFFKGKNVNLVVGFTAGGGYDQYARVFARHFDKHIPGKPNVIVQNAPGAGSLTAVKRLDASLPTDGTNIVTFNYGLITESLTHPEKASVNFTQYRWIGSITRDFRVCYTWHETGMKTWDDVAKRNEVVFGTTGPGTSVYINGAILRNVFGLKVRQILGYPGSAETRLALERGELHADCNSWSSIPGDWIRDKKIVPFVLFTTGRAPDMPADLPYIGTFAKTDEQKAILDVLTAAGELGRPYIVSPKVPADRVEALRAAFDATMKDKDYLAEAGKSLMPVYPISGAEAESIAARVYAVPPEMIAKAKKAAE
ncbi:MAG: tripartite tricarboxylate transporter substrate-binding protein [Beijerinckiaceae bacterium]|nr:tripartite tricarboxylate transporter substrate-binding protein [Beijerinckiaceae bacterium]